MKHILFLIYILGLTTLYSINDVPAQDSFQPHWIDHPIKGCLPNSLCNQNAGNKRLQWDEALKKKNYPLLNQLIKKNGYPFTLYLKKKEDDKLPFDTILWPSICTEHQLLELSQGDIFFTSLGELSQALKDYPQHLFFPDILVTLIKSSGVLAINEIPILINQLPTHLEKGWPVFYTGSFGHYYELLFQQSTLTIRAPKQVWPKFRAIECPSEFENAKKKFGPLYQYHQCLEFYDSQTKSFISSMILQSCSP